MKRAEMDARRDSVTASQRHGLVDANGMCADCGDTWTSRNALALAKQHAVRTGHEVHVEQTMVYIWNKKGG